MGELGFEPTALFRSTAKKGFGIKCDEIDIPQLY